MDSRLESLCQSFIAHNLSSGNFGSLVNVFLVKVSELLALSDAESTVHIWQAFNALFIIRCLVKYMIETGSEYQLLQHFEALPVQQHDDGEVVEQGSEAVTVTVTGETRTALAKLIDGTKFETFLEALVNIIVVIPVK